jgi:predicted DNA-binding transcriptional regulator AlpA
MSDRFLTRLEAARLLSCSPATLAAWQYRAQKAGRPTDAPPSVKIGKLRRYSEAELVRWIAMRAKAATRAASVRRHRGRTGR